MSFKSIRDSYSQLIQAFSESGVKLNESQKASLDTFIVALESKMSKQKEATVKATKKVVIEHLEKEYQKVFESILEHQAENAELAGKIQSKIQSINESKKISRAVNNYLDLYVESILPEKKIVDYDRMQKLEALHESLKDLLVVNEDVVKAKTAQLEESFSKNKKDYETQIAKLQVKLNESMSKTQALNNKIEQFKALELLESKTADLPTFEARKLKKRFANATTAEIEKDFTMVLESVQNEMKEEAAEEETTLEAEIKDIIEAEDIKENDILRNRKHNAHFDVNETEGGDKIEECDDTKEVNEQEFETMESVNFDESGDIVLDESEIIDSNLMKLWCSTSAKIR